MFEKFTDRSRKVFALANQEAQRFNHEYIGTEHILLGLVKEGSGVGAHALQEFEIDLPKVRLELGKLVEQGPETVTMGKLPQTPGTNSLILSAIEEARKLSHNYVGTEHLLLGLLHEHEGFATSVLRNLGVKLEEVRERVLILLGLVEETKYGPGQFKVFFYSDSSNGLERIQAERLEWEKMNPEAKIIAEQASLEDGFRYLVIFFQLPEATTPQEQTGK